MSALTNASKQAITEAQRLVGNYESIGNDGPYMNPFTNQPHEQQMASCVRNIRSGDVLRVCMQALPESAELLVAEMQLDESMRAYASRMLVHERPDDFSRPEIARRCLEETVKYERGSVHSNELVKALYTDSQAPYQKIWEPLSDFVKLMTESNEDELFAAFISRVAGIEDDNDLGCAIGAVYQAALPRYLDGGHDDVEGQLLYSISAIDSRVMGSELELNRAELLAYELNRHTQFESNKKSSPAPGAR